MAQNPFLPSRGLGVASAIAGGAQSFMNAYRDGQQRQIVNAREAEEIAMKRQYYQLQMKKLAKEVEPVQMDAMKIGIAAELFGADSKELSKMKMDAINNLQNPTQAAYAKKMIDMMSGPVQYDPAETEMIGKVVGLRSSENIRFSDQQTKERIAAENAKLQYEELISKNQQSEADRNLKMQEQQASYTTKMADLERQNRKDAGAYQVDLQKLQNERSSLDLRIKELEANAAREAKKLEQEREKFIAQEEGKDRRTKMTVNARRSSVQPKLSPDLQSLNDSISNDFKEITKISGREMGITETQKSRQQAIGSIEKGLLQKLDNWKRSTGKPHPSDPREQGRPIQNSSAPNVSTSASVSAPMGLFNDGRMGPVAPPAAAPAKVRVRNKQTGVTGTMPADKVTDKYEIIK